MNKANMKFAELFADVLEHPLLEVGSLDVNGSLRDVLPVDHGVDMRPGPGVDTVCKAEDLPGEFPGLWGSIASANMLEHAEHWDKALDGMWRSLAPNGLLFLTTCNSLKALHGYPEDYWRFTLEMFKDIFKDQFIWAIATVGFSEMIIVQKKTDTINLDIKPLEVAK